MFSIDHEKYGYRGVDAHKWGENTSVYKKNLKTEKVRVVWQIVMFYSRQDLKADDYNVAVIISRKIIKK